MRWKLKELSPYLNGQEGYVTDAKLKFFNVEAAPSESDAELRVYRYKKTFEYSISEGGFYEQYWNTL